MKILLVSPYPYSHTSRGMDVLTRGFDEEGWDVTHLTFPHVFYTPKVKEMNKGRVQTIFARKIWFPYIDRFMFWFPRFLFQFVKKLNTLTVKDISFHDFDAVVLESGKPLFLLDLIPVQVPVIYRLSDSVRFVLGKSRHYHDLERQVFTRASHLIFKKEIYRSFLKQGQKEKVTVIENGMVIPKNLPLTPSFEEETLNAVYVGLHQLDFPTLKDLIEKLPQLQFHIIGPCLSKKQTKKLESFENFHFYYFLPKEEYMPLLRDANLAIFPFRRTEAMKWFGLTSKLLHFMYFGLPVISYPTGFPGEFDGIPIRIAQSKEEFIVQVLVTMKENTKIDYPIDFEYFSEENRMGEYKKFIRKLEMDLE